LCASLSLNFRTPRLTFSFSPSFPPSYNFFVNSAATSAISPSYAHLTLLLFALRLTLPLPYSSSSRPDKPPAPSAFRSTHSLRPFVLSTPQLILLLFFSSHLHSLNTPSSMFLSPSRHPTISMFCVLFFGGPQIVHDASLRRRCDPKTRMVTGERNRR
jgi:hypothetical protein